ncbi:MAG: hypothetical protein R3B68_14785 [Phycisphaerales bacterium]
MTTTRRKPASILIPVATSAALLLFVAASAWSLPARPGRRSVVGTWLRGWPRARINTASPYQAILIPDSDGQWQIVDRAEYFEHLTSDRWSAEQREAAILGRTYDRSWNYGYFAVATRHRVAGVFFQWADYSSVVADPPPEARKAFLESLATSAEPGLATLANEVAVGNVVEANPLPLGYLQNTVTALALLAAPIVFPWRPLARVARRRPAWQCQACGYDLRGIPAGVCPECGTASTVE